MRVVLFILATMFVTTAAAEKRVALVIGNNAYVHLDADHQLEKAVNDANAVGDALEHDHFEVLRGQNLARADMLDKIYDLIGRIEPGDTAFFYFAGHGVALGTGNHLLPSDVSAIGEGPLDVQERRIASQSIAEADVIADLQERGARVTILVLDACRDNPFKRGGTRSLGLERGLGQTPEAKGVFSLYSAGFGQSALDRLSDDDPNPNSVFTRVLVPLLTKPGLHLDDLAYEVREQVAKLAATTPSHHEQVPAAYNQIIGGRIYLGGPPLQAPPSPGADEIAWSLIGDSGDARLIEAFIARFPQSPLSVQAQARLAALSPRTPADTGSSALPAVGISNPEDKLGIAGGGATQAYPVYAKWAEDFKGSSRGVPVTYLGFGSATGLKQLRAKTVEFATTDYPLSANELAQDDLVQWPLLFSAIVPVVNISGLTSDVLVLDGPTLADIFIGKITRWDDPAIARLNPNLSLPSGAITVIHRADGTFTTRTFTDYLSKVSAEWQAKLGKGLSVEWATGVGAKGAEGIAVNLANISNSISYAEFVYAKQNHLTMVKMVNRAGTIVAADEYSVEAAVRSAGWESGADAELTDLPGMDSWPIVTAGFGIMTRKAWDNAAGKAIAFFDWIYRNGDEDARHQGFVPVPTAVKAAMMGERWRKLEDGGGNPLVVTGLGKPD